MESKEPGPSATLVSHARAILRHSSELAQDVLKRGEHFDVALKQAHAEETKRRTYDAQMAELLAYAPGIAAMICRRTIDDGLVELQQRRAEVRQLTLRS